MPTRLRVVFESNELGPAVMAEWAHGERLLDICDHVRAPVLFSCRSASCGVCRINVLEGGDLLEPAGPDEMFVLDVLGASPNERLACQAIARPASGLVRLRWSKDA